MGEKISTHLKEIAFNTSRRSVRAALIPLLQVSDEMRKVIVILIDLLLFPPCFVLYDFFSSCSP
jgi:hypothetical protein